MNIETAICVFFYPISCQIPMSTFVNRELLAYANILEKKTFRAGLGIIFDTGLIHYDLVIYI